MIGKTIVNLSTAFKNQKNKDLGRWSLVQHILVLCLATAPTYSQALEDAKAAKPKVQAGSAAEEADDNTADESADDALDDDVEDVAADDKNEDDVEESAAPEAQALEAGEQLNKETEPPALAELPPAESMPELPPAESMQAEAPPAIVETVPVEPLIQKTDADMVEVIPREKTVEIEPRKPYSNYRERRTRSGFMFNVNAENLYFHDYASILDQKLYEELFGQEDLTLLQVQLDYKFNFFLGSFVVGAGYGHGTLIDDRIGEERSLTIGKKSVRAQWLLDSLTKEPYFVPYTGISYWQMGINEENTTLGTSISRDTGNGTAFTAGILIQLNWLEPQVAKQAYLGEGLENTYLDVFWTQYQNTDDELDPAFENDFNFGVGLRMEF